MERIGIYSGKIPSHGFEPSFPLLARMYESLRGQARFHRQADPGRDGRHGGASSGTGRPKRSTTCAPAWTRPFGRSRWRLVGSQATFGGNKAARPDSGTVQPQRDRLRDEADPPKVELVAWGEEKEGVQAGLGFEENTKDGKHVVGMGKPVRLVVKLRNSGKAVAEGSYTQSAYYERPPMVEDASGKPVPVAPPPSERGAWAIIKYTLKPGEERVLATPKVVFVSQRPVGEVSIPTVEATPGKYRIGFDGTGKVEVEVTK